MSTSSIICRVFFIFFVGFWVLCIWVGCNGQLKFSVNDERSKVASQSLGSCTSSRMERWRAFSFMGKEIMRFSWNNTSYMSQSSILRMIKFLKVIVFVPISIINKNPQKTSENITKNTQPSTTQKKPQQNPLKISLKTAPMNPEKFN